MKESTEMKYTIVDGDGGGRIRHQHGSQLPVGIITVKKVTELLLQVISGRL